MIVGIDEVGRGAWAGPLVVGAVVLYRPIDGLTDSKLLTKERRKKLSILIHDSAAVGLGWVEPAEIDQIGLTKAIRLGSERALAQIDCDYNQIIIDGNLNFLAGNTKALCLVKADQSIPAVSAASIVAKVARDQYMADQASIHNNYGFEAHVGYGTKLHSDSLFKHGICALHRRSFKPVMQYVSA